MLETVISTLRVTTEAALAAWESGDGLYKGDIHTYFGEVTDSWDPVHITHDAANVWKTMFGEELEEESPIDAILYGVASQAKNGAYAFIAAALGVDRRDLIFAVAEWSENQHNLPAPISSSDLMALVAKQASKRLAKEVAVEP